MQVFNNIEREYIEKALQARRGQKLEREQALLGKITANANFNPKSATEILIGNQNQRYKTTQDLNVNIVNKQISPRDLKIFINRDEQTVKITNIGNRTHVVRCQDDPLTDLKSHEDISLDLTKPWSMRFAKTRIEIYNLPELGLTVVGNAKDENGSDVKSSADWTQIIKYNPVVKVEEPAHKPSSQFMRAFLQAFSAPQS